MAVSSALYLSRVPARSFTPEVRLWCAAYTAFLLTLAPPTAPDSVFLPWQKSSSFFSVFHSPLRPLPSSFAPLSLSLFLLVLLAFSVVISPSGLRSWLVINESRKNRRTEGGSVDGLDSEMKRDDAKRRIDYRRSFEESTAAEMSFLRTWIFLS